MLGGSGGGARGLASGLDGAAAGSNRIASNLVIEHDLPTRGQKISGDALGHRNILTCREVILSQIDRNQVRWLVVLSLDRDTGQPDKKNRKNSLHVAPQSSVGKAFGGVFPPMPSVFPVLLRHARVAQFVLPLADDGFAGTGLAFELGIWPGGINDFPAEHCEHR